MGKAFHRKSVDTKGVHIVSITDKKHLKFENDEVIEAKNEKEEKILEKDPMLVEYDGEDNYWGGETEEDHGE